MTSTGTVEQSSVSTMSPGRCTRLPHHQYLNDLISSPMEVMLVGSISVKGDGAEGDQMKMVAVAEITVMITIIIIIIIIIIIKIIIIMMIKIIIIIIRRIIMITVKSDNDDFKSGDGKK